MMRSAASYPRSTRSRPLLSPCRWVAVRAGSISSSSITVTVTVIIILSAAGPPSMLGARWSWLGSAGLRAADKPEAKVSDASQPNAAQIAKWTVLNGPEIFGGKVSVKGGRMTVTYPGGGLFEKGFECRNRKSIGVLSDAKMVERTNPALKKGLMDGGQGKFSFLGVNTGAAVSSFELADDFKISFKIRIPIMLSNPQLVWYLNRQDKKNFLQVSFFREALLVERGLKRRKAARDPRFRGKPGTWFDRKSGGVPVEMIFKDQKMTIRMEIKGKGKDKDKGEMTEIVSMDGIDAPTTGKIALSFNKVSFRISDFRIEGKLPAVWLTKEFERLRIAGKLKTKKDVPPAKDGAPAKDGKKGDKKSDAKAGKKNKKKQYEGPDLDKPDPESEIDL